MSVVTNEGWPVHFAGNRVRIRVDQAGLRKAVETHFKYCSGDGGPIIANYQITTMSENCYSFAVNGSDFLSNLNDEQILWHLMQDSLTQLNGACKTGLVLHAAGVSYHDQGLVLCGKSGSGKSSLAAWLVADDLQYLSDEVIMIPRYSEEINGFCRSIILKPDSSFIWKQRLGNIERNRLLRFSDGSTWIMPTLLHPNAVRVKAVPRMLIFPRYLTTAQLSARRLTAAEALFRLLQCAVNARNFSDGGLATATRFVKHVAAYSLTYSDIEHAAQWIKQSVLAS